MNADRTVKCFFGCGTDVPVSVGIKSGVCDSCQAEAGRRVAKAATNVRDAERAMLPRLAGPRLIGPFTVTVRSATEAEVIKWGRMDKTELYARMRVMIPDAIKTPERFTSVREAIDFEIRLESGKRIARFRPFSTPIVTDSWGWELEQTIEDFFGRAPSDRLGSGSWSMASGWNFEQDKKAATLDLDVIVSGVNRSETTTFPAMNTSDLFQLLKEKLPAFVANRWTEKTGKPISRIKVVLKTGITLATFEPPDADVVDLAVPDTALWRWRLRSISGEAILRRFMPETDFSRVFSQRWSIRNGWASVGNPFDKAGEDLRFGWAGYDLPNKAPSFAIPAAVQEYTWFGDVRQLDPGYREPVAAAAPRVEIVDITQLRKRKLRF